MNRIMINFKKIMMFWISIKLMMNFKIRIKISQFYKKIQIFKAIKWICKKKKILFMKKSFKITTMIKMITTIKMKMKKFKRITRMMRRTKITRWNFCQNITIKNSERTWQCRTRSLETTVRFKGHTKMVRKRLYSAMVWKERHSLTGTPLFISIIMTLNRPIPTKK